MIGADSSLAPPSSSIADSSISRPIPRRSTTSPNPMGTMASSGLLSLSAKSFSSASNTTTFIRVFCWMVFVSCILKGLSSATTKWFPTIPIGNTLCSEQKSLSRYSKVCSFGTYDLALKGCRSNARARAMSNVFSLTLCSSMRSFSIASPVSS
ncbi:MAG: hypothetical protein BWY82_01322 [Verrucomicrobia bacterium ADurb.Bin474]|nr:MAG: hypothetical protein BWY82_01322 [Verrucomicrobia bacterium ADurb.Bin474]